MICVSRVSDCAQKSTKLNNAYNENFRLVVSNLHQEIQHYENDRVTIFCQQNSLIYIQDPPKPNRSSTLYSATRHEFPLISQFLTILAPTISTPATTTMETPNSCEEWAIGKHAWRTNALALDGLSPREKPPSGKQREEKIHKSKKKNNNNVEESRGKCEKGARGNPPSTNKWRVQHIELTIHVGIHASARMIWLCFGGPQGRGGTDSNWPATGAALGASYMYMRIYLHTVCKALRQQPMR